ncbi:MAG TPA: ABC transporter substrate-binding protein [Candidatus Limnocylindria bacterium]|nr:ABC transporter substrate-binding protein [Candidatus Limnocylindria bacterium]
MRKQPWLVSLVVLALLAVACQAAPVASPTAAPPAATDPPAAPATTAPTDAPGPTDEPAEPTDEPAEPTDPPTEPTGPAVPSTPSGYTELDAALAGDYTGTAVSIQTQWIGGEGANFSAALADFIAATGITIQVDSIGSSHETVLRTRIQGGQPPDLAMLAQPTAVLAYGAEGSLIDVSTIMDVEKLRNEHEATIGLVSTDDGVWGIPYKADVKSTVWYPIHYFEANNFQVPTTWDEMIALSDAILAAGSAPWCMGMEAGTATGWQFTDWVEEVMLRTTSPENYNAWIAGELPFTSPEVRNAFEMVGELMFTEGYVFGGTTAIVETPQTQPFDPAFPVDDNWDGFTPGCVMHKIPTWYGPDFFPDVRAGGPGTETMYEIGEDIGIFYLPMIDPAYGEPALGSADTLMVLRDRPEVRAVAQFLSTPQGIQRWIETGSAISANTTTPQEWYAGFYKLDVAAGIVNNASYLGFDASDLMPPEVGAGTFWTQGVEYIRNGGTNLDQVLQNIDASWPE